MKDLSEGNIYKNFILFAIPLVGAGLFSQFYSVFDTVIAGKFLGENGLAAIGATAPFITFVSSPFWGYSVGFSVYVATLFGARNFKQLKSSLITNSIVVAATALLIGLLSVIFIDPLFALLKVDPVIKADARIYFIICILGHFLVVLPHFFVQVMSALGASSFPFFISLLAGVLNIAGNIVSVVIFDFGIVGIACATVFSGAVVAVCYLFKFRACLKELGVHKEKFRVNFEALRRSFHYALPNTLQQMAMYCAGMAMSPVVNGLGSSATAGYSVVQRIFDISAGFYQNSSKALVNYGAQCVGAGKIRLLKRGWRAGLLQGTLLALPVIAVCSIFARPVCALFFPSGFYGAALEYAVFFARFCLPLIYLNLLNNLYHARFRGMGAMKLNLATTAFASVVRVGAGALLAIPFGMYGVFYGMVLSWAAEVVLCVTVDRIRFNTDEKICRFLIRNGTLPEGFDARESKEIMK
ncbi:MAG: hypothetical protein IKC43_02170 [Clostridia bacterium]|nr:hypothetical protein [Clostridia bacterium]